MQTMLRKIRREARRLLSSKGHDLESRKSRLLARVNKFLVKNAGVTLDDILSLQTRDILERRLQTVVIRKHMARTPAQSRQFITHGHVAISEQVVSSPSYLVSFEEEGQIVWSGKAVVERANASAEKTVKAEAPKEAAAVSQVPDAPVEVIASPAAVAEKS